MKSITYFVIVCVIVSVTSINYQFGERTNKSRLVQRDKVFLEAIPWKKRVKYYHFIGEPNLQIQAILCFDYQNSDASVNLTEGGIGENHFTLRMKSQRSYRLDYTIEIYQ